MAIIVETARVQDGTLPPTFEDRRRAEERNKPGLKPHQKGYYHPIGEPRYVERFIWVSTLSGKTSNGCTFPSVSAATRAGQAHERALVARANKKKLNRSRQNQLDLNRKAGERDFATEATKRFGPVTEERKTAAKSNLNKRLKP